MHLLAYLINLLVDVYITIIVIQVIVHWLVAFDVLKVNSPQAQNLVDLMRKLTDPVYKPLQKYIPPIGGIDITPIIVILLLSLVRNVLMEVLF